MIVHTPVDEADDLIVACDVCGVRISAREPEFIDWHGTESDDYHECPICKEEA